MRNLKSRMLEIHMVSDFSVVRVETIITTEKLVHYTAIYCYNTPVIFLNTKIFSIKHKTHKTNHK